MATGATYWNVSVQVDGSCKVSTGGETMADAIARGIQDAIYYKALYPEAVVAITGITQGCSRCYNYGTVPVRRGKSTREARCPQCKGKAPTGRVDDIPLRMPDAANRIRITQDT